MALREMLDHGGKGGGSAQRRQDRVHSIRKVEGQCKTDREFHNLAIALRGGQRQAVTVGCDQAHRAGLQNELCAVQDLIHVASIRAD